VVPGQAVFTIDIRAEQDAVRLSAVADVLRAMQATGQRRNVALDINQTHDAASVPCAPWLQAQLEQAIAGLGLPLRRLPSGAGHDAMAVAALTDVAMLFVRCGNGGISHHPDEIMTADDARSAAGVFTRFVEDFRPRPAAA
jgi:acetylornithine deacetylase/succinyl-diaminopimelate desuccinylase-like protein